MAFASGFFADGAGANSDRVIPVDGFWVVAIGEQEADLVVFADLESGGEVFAFFAAKTFQWADHAFVDEGADFLFGEFTPGYGFVDAQFDLGQFAFVELLGLFEIDLAMGRHERGEIRENLFFGGLRVGFGALDDLGSEAADVPHEGGAIEVVLLHLTEFVLPLAGHFRGA